jgi:hypothetical protein
VFPIGTIIKLVLYLAIALIIAGGAWYVTGLRADLAVSEANNQKLEDGIREQQSLIEMMQKYKRQTNNYKNKTKNKSKM